MDESGQKPLELTVRSVAAGVGIGCIVSAANIFMGLKVGWTEGGSLTAAVLGFALFRLINPKTPYTILENNMTQTSGSAAGAMASAAGLVAAIPALEKLGHEFSYMQLTFWAMAVALCGVGFAIPLRRQMVVIEKLRFPTGTACAETMRSMYSHGAEAVQKAWMLVGIAVFSFGFTWIRETGKPFAWLSENAVYKFPGTFLGRTFKEMRQGIYLTPMLTAAGFLVGPRVAFSMVAGSFLAWSVVGPLVVDAGLVEVPTPAAYYKSVFKFVLWPGVAVMVVSGFTELALQWRVFIGALTSVKGAAGGDGAVDDSDVPVGTWIVGMIIAATCAVIAAWWLIGIPPWMGVLAVMLSFALALVSVRATGETDINPVGAMGKVTQLAYGGAGEVAINIGAAAVTSGGASQAGDMMHDFKAGHLLGATPRKQVIGQIFGILIGAMAVVPIYIVVKKAYGIGTEAMPAPAVSAWLAMGNFVTQGMAALPPGAGWATLVGTLIGIAIPVLKRTRAKPFLPNAIGMGIACMIPGYYCTPFAIGALAWVILRRTNRAWIDKYNASIASGGIAGEGVAGVAVAAYIVYTMMNT